MKFKHIKNGTVLEPQNPIAQEQLEKDKRYQPLPGAASGAGGQKSAKKSRDKLPLPELLELAAGLGADVTDSMPRAQLLKAISQAEKAGKHT